MLTPTQVAEKWSTAVQGAGTAYTNGINAVQVAPGQLAAAQSAKYLAKIQANVAKWERNVSSVSLQAWKTAATTTGAQRLATGATKGMPKVQAFMTVFLPYLEANAATIKAMPTNTFEQAMAKAYAQALYNHQFPGYR